MVRPVSALLPALLSDTPTRVRADWPFLFSVEADGALVRNVPQPPPAPALASAGPQPAVVAAPPKPVIERRVVRAKPRTTAAAKRERAQAGAAPGGELGDILTQWRAKP